MAGNFIILEVTEVGGRIGPFKAPLGAIDATFAESEIQISFLCLTKCVFRLCSQIHKAQFSLLKGSFFVMWYDLNPVFYLFLAIIRSNTNRLIINYIYYIILLHVSYIVLLPSFTQQNKSGRTGVLNSAPTKLQLYKLPFFLVCLFCVFWHTLI